MSQVLGPFGRYSPVITCTEGMGFISGVSRTDGFEHGFNETERVEKQCSRGNSYDPAGAASSLESENEEQLRRAVSENDRRTEIAVLQTGVLALRSILLRSVSKTPLQSHS